MTKSSQTQGVAPIDRRTFLITGLATAGALAGRVGSASAAPVDKQITTTGRIPERPFGRTGHVLPVLGCGGSALVQTWAAGYGVKLGSESDRIEMVRHGYEQGIRYFDTARVYSESERVMGRALADVRHNVYLATKVADPRPEKTRESVETSLEQLGTDYVDAMQIHSPAIERVGYDGAMRIHDQLAKMRDEGLIRFLGVTTHVAFEEVYKLIDTGLFDQVLLARGYLRKGMDMMLSNRSIEWASKCVARAHELGMAIVVMKVMGLNMLGRGGVNVVADYDPELRRRLPGAAIRWALRDPRTSVLNIGVSVPEDIVDNIATVTSGASFSDEDAKLLADYASRVYESDYVKAMRVV